MRLPGHSPLGIAELVKDVITGKVVCDIGCGQGELLLEFAKYAKEVIGIEEDETVAQIATDKGLTIHRMNSFFQELPKANVYYLWTKDEVGVFLKAKHDGVKATFILGHSIRPATVKFLESLNAEVRNIDDFKIYIVNI